MQQSPTDIYKYSKLTNQYTLNRPKLSKNINVAPKIKKTMHHYSLGTTTTITARFLLFQ